MIINVTGDFHLRDDNVEELHQILYQILQVSKHCNVICVLGDLFDNSHPSALCIKEIINFLQQIPITTTIYIISGNHDIKKNENALEWIPLIHPNIVFSNEPIVATLEGKTVRMAHMNVNESKIGP